MATIRFYAAAREAAGTETVTVTDGPLTEVLPDFGSRLSEVLAVSTLLCDGRRLSPSDVVRADDVVDVLPPFAGG